MATLPKQFSQPGVAWRPMRETDLATVAALEAQILNLSVVPEARRQGLGRELLRYFIDDARWLHAGQIFLEVRTSNVAAIALYEAEGFAPVARRLGYYPGAGVEALREDALVMRRSLRNRTPPTR